MPTQFLNPEKGLIAAFCALYLTISIFPLFLNLAIVWIVAFFFITEMFFNSLVYYDHFKLYKLYLKNSTFFKVVRIVIRIRAVQNNRINLDEDIYFRNIFTITCIRCIMLFTCGFVFIHIDNWVVVGVVTCYAVGIVNQFVVLFRPPCALFLGASGPASAEIASDLSTMFSSWSIAFLLHYQDDNLYSYMTRSTSFRTDANDEDVWTYVVSNIADFVPIIIVDARQESSPLFHEVILIVKKMLLRAYRPKVFLVTNDEISDFWLSPLVDLIKSAGIKICNENYLGNILRSIYRSNIFISTLFYTLFSHKEGNWPTLDAEQQKIRLMKNKLPVYRTFCDPGVPRWNKIKFMFINNSSHVVVVGIRDGEVGTNFTIWPGTRKERWWPTQSFDIFAMYSNSPEIIRNITEQNGLRRKKTEHGGIFDEYEVTL